jgi:hypothetical protein
MTGDQLLTALVSRFDPSLVVPDEVSRLAHAEIESLREIVRELEAENAKLRELLKRCRSYVDYEIMEILDRGGVPVDHVRLIEEIDQVIGRWREGE